jgi:sugar/nucleoside kinase (ribokinase family)
MFSDMAAKYDIRLHPRYVKESSLSFIMPNNGKRAIVRCRDNHYLSSFPRLDLAGLRALHLDGHQPDAAMYYAKTCREAGVLTSLDGGAVRSNTDELLNFIDIAIVAERFCEQRKCTPPQIIDYPKGRGCRVGGVTLGEHGLLWYDESGSVRTMPALPVPKEKVIDTSGAGDVFHGAYIFSYLSDPKKKWEAHFEFARRAAAFKIQHLGNEAGLPTLDDIRKLPFAPEAPNRPRIVSSH